MLLVFDSSRDVDLDTTEFINLEPQAQAFRMYNLLYNVVILGALFSMLQYTGLDDKMAMLTNTISRSLADLLPFMIIFLMFVFIFAVIGMNLYGPVLEEFSHLGKALVTSVDLIVGNYQVCAHLHVSPAPSNASPAFPCPSLPSLPSRLRRQLPAFPCPPLTFLVGAYRFTSSPAWRRASTRRTTLTTLSPSSTTTSTSSS